jgi:uracil-DNA glycosylase family 4
MKPLQLSPWQSYVKRWSGGCGSDQCSRAGHVVLARGKVPCDVLFVGEAPGASEDIRGIPFDGPAGQVLDRIVARGLDGREDLRVAFTNLVGCIPRGEDGKKAGEPEEDQIEACKPRLSDFIRLADPRLIVCVGRLADDWLSPGFKHSVPLHRQIPMAKIVHPAAILRAPIVQQGLMTKRCVVILAGAVADL